MVQIITLVALVLAIFIGAKWKVNTGFVALAFSFVVGVFIVGMTASQIYGGFPDSTIFKLVGMTFLFGIAKVNGTLSYVAKAVTALSKGNAKLVPFLVFIVTAIISGVGPGGIVTCAILFPIAMEIANDNDISDFLMCITVIAGSLVGGAFPICATGVVGASLALELGEDIGYQIWLYSALLHTLLFIIGYIFFGGLKLKNRRAELQAAEKTQNAAAGKINNKQVFTLVVLAITIIGILVPSSAVSFLGWDVALAPFVGGTVLLLFGAARQDEVVASMPWSTLLLISGMAMLVNVATVAGGIDALSEFLSSVMTENTASAIMAVLAGLMSSVSSATGVVMPTLMPTTPGIVEAMAGSGVTVSALCSAIAIGAFAVTYSPLSTLGALGMANATGRTDRDKLFLWLLLFAIGAVILAGLLGLVGIYR